MSLERRIAKLEDRVAPRREPRILVANIAGMTEE